MAAAASAGTAAPLLSVVVVSEVDVSVVVCGVLEEVSEVVVPVVKVVPVVVTLVALVVFVVLLVSVVVWGVVEEVSLTVVRVTVVVGAGTESLLHRPSSSPPRPA